MSEKITVVALGHRALGTTLPEQKIATKKAAKAVADLVEAGNRVVISHSNGPQVGMIHTAMNEFGKTHPDYTFAPMSVCSAMSQGYIGYDLQTAIRAELISRGIYKPVATILTQVVIDPHRLLEGLHHLGGVDGDGLGQARHQAAALDLNGGLLLLGIDAADLHLHLLRCALADEDIVLAAHIFDDGLVELIAGHLDGGRLHHAGEADDGNVAGAAADIHHHMAVGLGDVDAGTDGRRHGLLDEVDTALSSRAGTGGGRN